MPFAEWWDEFSKKYSLDDADSLKSDFHKAWREAFDEGYRKGEFNALYGEKEYY